MIDEEKAIAIARSAAAEAGWAWVDPIDIDWRADWLGKRGKWEIQTNAKGLGAKIRIIVSDEGEIVEKGYIPR